MPSTDSMTVESMLVNRAESHVILVPYTANSAQSMARRLGRCGHIEHNLVRFLRCVACVLSQVLPGWTHYKNNKITEDNFTHEPITDVIRHSRLRRFDPLVYLGSRKGGGQREGSL